MAKVGKEVPQKMGKYINELYQTLSTLSQKEATALLDDLLTPMEKKMLAKRIQIAKMILAERKYREIEKTLNVQKTTIARIRLAMERSHTKALQKAAARISARKRT
jgi:uncharacterized protein YerC